MAYVPIEQFLLRAPLLAGAVFGDPGRLLRDPLGRMALALASPSLAARPEGERAARASGRYARRAAFRATPSGLLAGVAVGVLGKRTGGATGQPRANLDLGWARVAALGRALIEDRAIRGQVHLRHAPSLLRGADRVRWLAFGVDSAEERQADLDARLARILEASRGWAPWAALRAAARGDVDHPGNDNDRDAGDPGAGPLGDQVIDAANDNDNDNDDEDELLLLLIDDGLLHHDLMPPLIGPPAAAWMSARLETLRPPAPEAQSLARVRTALHDDDLDRARTLLRALPGGDDADATDKTIVGAPAAGVNATLVHQPARAFTLDRATVGRAAQVAPLLFRLQQALTPPGAERLADGGTRRALDTARELFGDGSLDAAAWEMGDYGVDPGAPPHAGDGDRGAGDEDQSPARSAAPLVRLLVDQIASARAHGRGEIALSAAALDVVLPAAPPPPTCELFLTPTTTRAGWLLGVHAPAGASWGRFGAALGASLAEAFAALAAAERAARPQQRRLDVAYAPSRALADLCAHPPVRDEALCLSTWPARDTDGGPDALTADALGLVVIDDDAAADTDTDTDDAQQAQHSLVLTAAGSEVFPSPLARVRSLTAPPGLFRLLAGFGLYRQHAPWALSLGPLADLAHVPRISIEGFVVAPASWRIPAGLDARALRRWRRGSDGAPPPPRFIQVGAGDELLPVDLDDADAARDLAGQPRAWEIWPPLPDPGARGRGGRARRSAKGVDRDGRRIEAVVALVDFPDEDQSRQLESRRLRIEHAGAVPPPRITPAAPGWRTFALYGVEERQDDVLLDAVAPAVRGALDARDIDHWFFVRYVDARGRRPHLRLRIHASDRAGADAFAARLDVWLRAAHASGAIALVEIAAYHPEVARFGGPDAMTAALAIFQSDSELACTLLAADRSNGDPELATERMDLVDWLVATFDSLTAGLGLERAARHQLARRRRHAEAALSAPDEEDEGRSIDADFRARARRLRAALGAPPQSIEDDKDHRGPGETDDAVAALAAHRDRVAAAIGGLGADAPVRLAPPLLHLTAVRLLGADRAIEARAYLFWERTLEGLLRSPPRDRSKR